MVLIKNLKELVFEETKKIPKGYVSTYKNLGDRIGSKSYRKIGSILKTNKSDSIPCHRVILSSGKIGEYNKGSYQKAKLLETEGILIIKSSKDPREWRVKKNQTI